MKKKGFERFLEILPASLSYLVLFFPIVLSLFCPEGVAIFIILFDFYWLNRALVMGVYLLSAYWHLKYEESINWSERLRYLKNPQQLLLRLKQKAKNSSLLERRRISEEILVLKDLLRHPQRVISPSEVFHAVIYTTYKEPFEVLYKSISAVADSDFPNKRIILVLATEARSGKEGQQIARRLKAEFKDVFYKFLITVHPDNIVGELKAKGANATWAGKRLKEFIDRQGIEYEKVVVSIFDADTRPAHSFFSALTYKYLLHADRIYHSFQPIPLYSNNIWQVPPLVRLVAFGSSFWQLIESTRPYRLINFSSQSLSFKTLVDIDFWDTKIVSEDSRTYYRVFFRYQGRHSCIPIFIPVYMDAIYAPSIWQTLKNQYLQKRRWAWGVEHFPYLVKKCLKHKEINFWSKWSLVFRLLESHVSWASTSLLIALGGWWPFLLNPYFQTSVLSYYLPFLAQRLLALTWIGLIISGFVSVLLLPPRPKNYGKIKTLGVFVSWVFVPITAIFFGSFPAISAQTRLMLGKYLGFWVTPKELAKN
ncbi:glycosyltransferase family 2 protein [bacterium]|nr:glycosyltransferase family 2 protein [bacterium]